MADMSVTADVSHSLIYWSNAWAPSNMADMSVTADVSQSPIGWLNKAAPLNIETISVIRVVTILLNGTGIVCPCADGVK